MTSNSYNHYYEKFDDGTINDITEEIPFDIPDSWCWCKLYNVADVYTGNSISESIKQQKYSNLKEGYNFIATKDVGFDNKINYNNGIKIPYKEEKFKIALSGSTLMCIEGGSVGRKIGLLNENVCFGNKLASINAFKLNKKYVFYLIQSSLLRDFIKINLTGIIGGISINRLKQFIFPIPPLEEQNLIVKKIETILPYINEYEDKYNTLDVLNNSYTEELKKSILQYAIQGKLVKQDNTDEPASILINKILDEKRKLMKSKEIKKENLSIIYKDTDNQFYEKFDDGTIINITDEIPFGIPNNWCWTRLSNICTKIVDGDHNPPKGQINSTDYIMLSAKNIQDNSIVNLNEARFLTKEDYEKGIKRINLTDGDILLTIVGTLGRSCIYEENEKKFLFQRSVSVITSLINNNYLKFIFDSPYIQYKMLTESTGIAQKGFYLNQLSKIIVPIAPENEQKQIIKKINKLFELI